MGITLNNVAVPDPTALTWGLQDVSASDAGRDEATTMHKMRLGQKRTYTIEWAGIDRANASIILQAINSSENFPCYLFDVMNNQYETRTYYVGDRSAPFKQWFSNDIVGMIYTKLSFTLIEV